METIAKILVYFYLFGMKPIAKHSNPIQNFLLKKVYFDTN